MTWITLGQFAADPSVPTNDREKVKKYLKESKWIDTKEEDGIFKARVNEAFMREFNGELLACTSDEERNEIFAKAIQIEDEELNND